MTQQQLQREIKFRAWVSKHNYMLEIFNSVQQTEWYIPNLKDLEVMQYIGLKDSTGKEIFESDIILYINSNGREYHLVVKYDEKDAKFSTGGIRIDLAITGVVVGNIYEHPELLES